MTSSVTRVFASAKVNLTLHVTGQREDGYHLLDSLVVFADVGDTIILSPRQGIGVAVDGPESGALPVQGDNLVARAIARFGTTPAPHVTLTKNLPVSSGIGGGSADAAAVVRGLLAAQALLTGSEPELQPLERDLLSLGADVPVCLHSRATRMQGIGDVLTQVSDLPALHAVLVNPRRAVSTPTVFRAMASRSNPPMPDKLPVFRNTRELTEWLGTQRNDMEVAALGLAPAIAAVKTTLVQSEGCQLARMSGSGATCFGLFPDDQAAAHAAQAISDANRDWWVRAVTLGDQAALATPEVS